MCLTFFSIVKILHRFRSRLILYEEDFKRYRCFPWSVEDAFSTSTGLGWLKVLFIKEQYDDDLRVDRFKLISCLFV